jgi:hypothetical protein
MQSAKTNQNVEQVFFTVARDIKQRLTETVAAAAEVAILPLHMLYPHLIGCHVNQSHRSNLHRTMQPPTIQISRPDPDQPNPASRWSSCCNTWSTRQRNRTAPRRMTARSLPPLLAVCLLRCQSQDVNFARLISSVKDYPPTLWPLWVLRFFSEVLFGCSSF